MEILTHPLAWRWTEEKHTLLPENILSQMHPLNAFEAESLWERTSQFLACDGLAEEVFEEVISLDTSAFTPEVGRDWMRKLQPDPKVEVCISWDQRTAIRTTWKIFTSYWDAMCYPASDDVVIVPDSEDWALYYYHEETLHFGRKPTHPKNAASHS
jgi:hypothetical protein